MPHYNIWFIFLEKRWLQEEPLSVSFVFGCLFWFPILAYDSASYRYKDKAKRPKVGAIQKGFKKLFTWRGVNFVSYSLSCASCWTNLDLSWSRSSLSQRLDSLRAGIVWTFSNNREYLEEGRTSEFDFSSAECRAAWVSLKKKIIIYRANLYLIWPNHKYRRRNCPLCRG